MTTITSLNNTASSAFDLRGTCRTREAYWRRLALIVAVFAGVFIVTGIFVSTFQTNFVTMTGGLSIFVTGLGALAAVVTLVVQRLRALGAHWAFVFLLLIPPLAAIMIVTLGIVTPAEPSVKHTTKRRTTKSE